MARTRLNAWIREEIFGPILTNSTWLLFACAYVWRRVLVRTTFIGITGSLGKTTTKECLAVVLSSQGRTFRSYENQNSPAGVALNILRVRPWHRYAVIEIAGASPGMMDRSAPLVRPDVAIVLNVLRTHTIVFTGLEQHAIEKAKLLDSLNPNGSAVLNADDAFVSQMGGHTRARVYRFGTQPNAEYRVTEVPARWPARLSFTFEHGATRQQVDTQLVGSQWLMSAAAVMTASVTLGVDVDAAARALKKAEPFPGRMQPRILSNGAIVLRDDYAASVDTVEPSLQVLANATAERRFLVVTDMSDMGRNRKQRLKYLAARSAEVSDFAVFIGEIADYGKRRAIEAGLSADSVHAFDSLRPAAEFLRTELRSGDVVLLKGRTTDHATRIFFAQLGEVGCWKADCRKRMLCDTCWELGFKSH
ncbi:MAG TPA: UDP-N-acetylmuramoyl-tripeptide--D-alanyl-D-alanine ligase [Gemmatimonadaceae bacterium]|nr:UDP-N-acetylmuramoyl-tripeptide--D-alanyl-D-alanine ligase [Gemmatimonadaceae bacterium]